MTKTRLLFLIVLLAVPSLAYAQRRSAAADKSWNAFWTQFSSAVKSKNKAAVKALMCAEKDFLNGGGIETRDQWLAAVQKEKLWGELQRSVAKGTAAYDLGGKPARVTKDQYLIFEFTGNRWRFRGIMGD